IAYVCSDWTENTSPFEFGYWFNLRESTPQLRGLVFTDRGVYKPGEEVHFKAIVRHDMPDGAMRLTADAPLKVVVRDTNDKIVDRRGIRLNAWSSSEWTLRIPDEGALGAYSIAGALAENGEEASTGKAGTDAADDQFGRGWVSDRTYIRGSFVVAAYRRPDF